MLEPIALKNSGQDFPSLSLAEYDQSKTDELNDAEGNLNGDNCPLCKNRGYIARVENGCILTRKCFCMVKREAMRLLEQSGLSDSIERLTLDNYDTPNEWQKKAKHLAQSYIESPDGWFAATGGIGSGKTHLCTAIYGKLINSGVPTRYMQWRTDAPRLKALVNCREDYEFTINPFKRVRCLYIDDFFKGNVTEADINLAFEILNERYNSARLMTIISSEKSISDILSIDEAIGSRIYERSKNFLIEIAKGNNWRLA